MSTPDQVYARLRKAPQAIERGHNVALAAAAQKARTVMLAAPGAPHRVKNKPVGVSVKKLGPNDVAIRWTPLAHIVDQPTKPHLIQRKAFVGTRGRGKRARKGAAVLAAFGVDANNYGGPLNIPGVGYRATAHHPGTKGKHFVDKGKKRAIPAASEVYAKKAMTEPLKSTFHG